jgi:UDP-perosamine 4-acetyltransferase
MVLIDYRKFLGNDVIEDNDCIIDCSIHIMPGVTLSGRVKNAVDTILEAGIRVIQGIKVGSGSIISDSSLVINDILDGVIVYGAPAKVV